jgi:glucose-1-phosphate cytidylyltransferase
MGRDVLKRSTELTQVPIIILCGGKGVLQELADVQRSNKALIRVVDKPLVYWVIQAYALHGATEFILAVGFQAEQFGAALQSAGAHVVPGSAHRYLLSLGSARCEIQLVFTAPKATTGSRLLSCREVLNSMGPREFFGVTYSDTLSDLDLGAEMRFHRTHGLVATMVAARMPVRFRVLGIRTGDVLVRAFAERPVIEGAPINGGYYLFSPKFWSVASSLSASVALENEPLEQLAAAAQLAAFEHRGSWQTCDAERDLIELRRLALELESELEPELAESANE